MVAEGKLDLQKPISTYLENIPGDKGDKITLHHLLTHSSGLIRDIDLDHTQYHRPQQLVDLFIEEELLFEPGERFEYSNCGYILLGHLIETVRGNPYKEVLEEYIFKPLGMSNSGFYRHRTILENRSSGYTHNFMDYRNSNYRDFSNAFSAGALYSTVQDMYLFDQALYSETLLPKELLELAFDPHMPDEQLGGFYGYGWEIGEREIGNSGNSVKTISHSGSLPDYCAIFTRIPSSNTTIVVLGNTGRAWLNAITKGVIAILNNESYDLPRTSAAKTLYEELDNKGVEQGISTFLDIKDNPEYYVDEDEMNILSYIYLQRDEGRTASVVLSLAIDHFPEAFNLYDSYGEVLLSLGEREKAIENYKKSVELNPDNRHGIQVLKELGVE